MYKFVMVKASKAEEVMNAGEKEGYQVVSTCSMSCYINPKNAAIFITFHKKGK